jgi:hypothetical protein
MAPARLRLSTLIALLLIAAAPPLSATPGRVAVIDDLVIDEQINGDVLVVRGDVTLGENARVAGHVVVLLGTVDAHPGAAVGGRVIALSSLASLAFEPGVEDRVPYLPRALKVLNAGGWLLVTSLFAFLLPVRLRRGLWLVEGMSWRVAAVGVMASLTFLAAVLAVLGLGRGLGTPIAAALMVLFLLIKAAGLAVIGAWLGTRLLRRWPRRSLPFSIPSFVGVLLMLVLRYLPVVGGAAWTVLSIVALGAGVLAAAVVSDRVAMALHVSPDGGA